MATKLSLALAAVSFAALLTVTSAKLNAQQSTDSQIRIGGSDLGGVVTSAKGPEAGVWVIAETADLPTKFAKIVVTDDQGRYVIPGLPNASYSVWVRGYGLVDSPKLQARPGAIVNLTAVEAPTPAAAADYYPALYWYALLKIPGKSEFSGSGGNGIPPALNTQEQWLDIVKTDGCYTCHQIGDKATRTIPKELGHFESSVAAWERRIQSGQASGAMVNAIGRLDTNRALALFADWTDRIAAGELPAPPPPRPQGVERNVVLSIWDWATPSAYLHDEVSTDKRNPTVNANGLIYGSPEESTDFAPILDPAQNATSQVKLAVRDSDTPSTADDPILMPSPFWGNEAIWNSQANAHNPMFDELGRVWFTSRLRPPGNPAFCKAGSDNPSAKLFPLESSGRQASMYDPNTKKFTLIDTCFSTHHLQFAQDANNTLWFSSGGGGGVVGWLDRKKFEETGDAAKSQGWTALVLDTNGNGQRDAYVEPEQPADPAKDKRIAAAFYGIAPSPADGSIWGSVVGFPGAVVRLNLGTNPPATALAEYYELPLDKTGVPVHGYSPRGMDIDSDGVVWQLWLILGDGVNQAADLASGATSIPSWNLTPWMTFGNWF